MYQTQAVMSLTAGAHHPALLGGGRAPLPWQTLRNRSFTQSNYGARPERPQERFCSVGSGTFLTLQE